MRFDNLHINERTSKACERVTTDKKPYIRYKVHREGVGTPETQQQRGKKNIAFRDTVPALSVYFKRRFTEKMESYTKPTVTSPDF